MTTIILHWNQEFALWLGWSLFLSLAILHVISRVGRDIWDHPALVLVTILGLADLWILTYVFKALFEGHVSY